MAEIHKIIATLKTALETGGAAMAHTSAVPHPVPVRSVMYRAELATSLARELEAVGGKFLGILSPAETTARIAVFAGEIGARTVSLGTGLALDMEAVGEALERAGCTLVRTLPVADIERAAMRERVANSDLGIAEAEYAIASTGTLAVVSTDSRPSSLTLLPPASLLIVQIERILPTLADALAALGAGGVAANRMTLITGPSRTADIEKRIVLGVHGPKSLYLIIVWPRDE